jgi:hypothetical protein
MIVVAICPHFLIGVLFRLGVMIAVYCLHPLQCLRGVDPSPAFPTIEQNMVFYVTNVPGEQCESSLDV